MTVIIWMFVASVMVLDTPMTPIDGKNYAFTTQASCERAIFGKKALRCISIELRDESLLDARFTP